MKINYSNIEVRSKLLLASRKCPIVHRFPLLIHFNPRLLLAAAANIRSHYVMVRKMKAIYHILNQFNQRDGGRVLIGECWMPVSSPHTTSHVVPNLYNITLNPITPLQTADIPNIQSALTAGAHQAGSTLPPTIEKVHTNEMHPTYNRFGFNFSFDQF